VSKSLKTIIFCSIGLLLLVAWHFATVFGIVGSPPETRAEFFVRIGLFMGAFLISSIVSFFFIALKDESEIEPDEREELIGLRVERQGILVIYAGLICLMWFVFIPMEPMQVANAILGVLWISEAFKVFVGLKLLRSGTSL